MIIKTPTGQTLITWQMLIVIFATAFGIYLGGVTSGYFIARAEYAQRAIERDARVEQLNKKVDQLPQQMATEANKNIEEGEKK